VKCAKCKKKVCYAGKDCPDMRDEMKTRLLADPEALRLLKAAAKVEAEHYMKLTRVAETMEFARNLGFTKLGLAFCVGFSNEAARLNEIFEKNGFNVSSVCCKVCGIDKAELDLPKLYGPEREIEATCNPVTQAEILNRDQTELNVLLGLCVGHDALFVKHSAAPATTLVVKDRVLGHNPVAALYSNYYRRRFDGEI
jgi:uncharacterized metal-binding protein